MDSQIVEDFKQALVRLLFELDDICKDNDIQYFLAWGTLLGAVRHNDIVPWDHDADIWIVESEYQKLVQLYTEGKLPEYLVVEDHVLNPLFPRVFGRLIDTRVACILPTCSFGNASSGVFIDIFRLWPLPSGEDRSGSTHTEFLVYEELVSWMGCRCRSRTSQFKSKWLETEREIQLRGKEVVMSEIRNRLLSINGSASEWYYQTSSGGKSLGRELLKRDWFDDAVYFPFSERMLPVPSGYLELLRVFYGDSWRFYPKKKPTMKSLPNLNVPCAVAMEDYLRLMDKEKVYTSLHKLKELGMADMLERSDFIEPVYKLQGALTLAHMRENLEKCGFNFTALLHKIIEQELDEEYFSRIRLATQEYIKIQMNLTHKLWRITIPAATNEIIAAAYSATACEGAYWSGLELLKFCNFSASNDPNASEALKTHILISDMHLAMDAEDVATASVNLEELKKSRPGFIDVALGTAWLASRTTGELGILDQVKQIRILLDRFPNNGELQSYLGDLWLLGAEYLLSENDKIEYVQNAKACYLSAVDLTENGMIIMHCTLKLREIGND